MTKTHSQNYSRIRFIGIIAAILLIIGAVREVSAEQVKIFTGPPPSANELAAMMFPERTSESAPVPTLRTRAIVLVDKQKPRLAPTQRPEGFGFLINFEYNSAKVLSNSRPYLDQVAEMLQLPELADQSIVIEGHTDASGSAPYNHRLSQQRALAVKQYLVKKHQVAPSRLITAGKGEAELLPNRNPRDAMNRRVQFHRTVN